MISAANSSRLYINHPRSIAEKTDIGRLAGPSLSRLVDEAIAENTDIGKLKGKFVFQARGRTVQSLLFFDETWITFTIMDDHLESVIGDASSGEKTNEGDSTQSEAPNKRRSRGPSKLEKLEGKGPFSLEWDKDGCSMGQYATSFARYCAMVVMDTMDKMVEWDGEMSMKVVDGGLLRLAISATKKTQGHAFFLCYFSS